jgi:hypothetical protein
MMDLWCLVSILSSVTEPDLRFALMAATVVERDIKVTDEVYWHLVGLKLNGKFRSVDEALRPILGLKSGSNPYLKHSHEVGVLDEKRDNR